MNNDVVVLLMNFRVIWMRFLFYIMIYLRVKLNVSRVNMKKNGVKILGLYCWYIKISV